MGIFQAVLQLLLGAQMEIMLFIIAVCAHALLFSKHRIFFGAPIKAKAQQVTLQGQPQQAGKAAPASIQAVKSLLRQRAGCAALRTELEECLKAAVPPAKGVSGVLADVLEALGRATTTSLLRAVRDILRERTEAPSPRLAELLLRQYLNTGLLNEFNEVLSVVQEANKIDPSIAILAVRASLNLSDLELALDRIRGFADKLKIDSDTTPSAALQSLVQPLIRLAGQKAKSLTLVRELHSAGLLSGSTLEVVLAAMVKGSHVAAVREAEGFARSAGLELTQVAYSWLVRGAGDAGTVKQLFAEAVDKGRVGDELLVAAAESVITHQDCDLAEMVLRYIPTEPTSEVAAAMLNIHAKVPLAGQDPDIAVLGIFEKCLADVDLMEDARASFLIAEAASRQNRPDLLSKLLSATPVGARHVALLKSFSAEHKLSRALEVFHACPGKSTCLYNALLDACIDCQDMEAAEGVMSEAVSAKMADVVTYNTLIKKLLQCGDSARARTVIETMRAAGGSLAPNAVTFNEFIDSVIRTNREVAWQLIEEMTACGLQPTGVTCSILLKGIQKSSRPADVERTMAFVSSMDEAMDEVLLSSVCEACIRVGRADLLWRCLRRQRGPKAIAVTGAHTFGSLIRAYGFVQDLEGARWAWDEMHARGIIPTSITVGCMIEALATNGDPDGGHQLIRQLLDNKQTRHIVNSVMYGSVLKGFSQQKRFDRVWQIYDEMCVEKMQFSLVTYNALINTCVRSGELARIPGLLEDMAREGIEPNLVTYSTVLKAYCQENRLDKAFELLEEMKRSGQLKPDEITYNIVIDGCARNCLYDRGLTIVKEMEQQGVQPSAYTLSLLVKLANRCHKLEKAFELCDEIARKYKIQRNIHVYNNLICACTTHGDMRRALGLLEKLLREKVRPDVRTWTLLLRGCLGANELSDVAGLLRTVSGLRGGHPRISGFSAAALQPQGGLPSEVFSEVLEGIACKCGDEPLAVQLLRDLRNAPGVLLDPKLSLSLTSKALTFKR